MTFVNAQLMSPVVALSCCVAFVNVQLLSPDEIAFLFIVNVDLQEKLFNVVGLPMVENCMAGYNSCMFAYGQVNLLHQSNLLQRCDFGDCRQISQLKVVLMIFGAIFLWLFLTVLHFALSVADRKWKNTYYAW
jgi:hypothetical protein